MEQVEQGGIRRTAWRVAAAPPLGMLLALPFGVRGEAGVFQADLVALVLTASAAGFGLRATRAAVLALAASVCACFLVHLALGGPLGGGLAFALLLLACALAASGLAAVGRGLGAPWLSAGGVGAAVLWVAMTGLFWADPLAESLPRARRDPFRQAVLHLDLATACAYDGAGYNRLLHDKRIYLEVPLASSPITISAPSAGSTGLAWLLLGLAGWGVALLLGVDRARASRPGEDGRP